VTDSKSAPIDAEPKKLTRRDVVSKLAGALRHADPGALAALRRAEAGSPPAAFYRLAGAALDEHLGEGGPLRERLEPAWTIIVSAMARAQGFLAPVPLGEALAKAGVAEMRFLRLLEAQPAQLPELVRNVVHQLVQKGQPFDPNDLANLVLARDDDRASHRSIARSYYRHVAT